MSIPSPAKLGVSVNNQPKPIHEYWRLTDTGYSSSHVFVIDDVVHLFDVDMPGPVVTVQGKTLAPPGDKAVDMAAHEEPPIGSAHLTKSIGGTSELASMFEFDKPFLHLLVLNQTIHDLQAFSWCDGLPHIAHPNT
jgi:hypothetical protein